MNQANERNEALSMREVDSPLGTLTLLAEDDALVGLYFEGHRPAPRVRTERLAPSAALDAAEAGLAAYFRDPTQGFRVRLAPRGTALQQAVWAVLADIPLGTTRTYGAIARTLGRPSGARAIGAAVARNPLSIVVPCHRAIGAGGSLTGFAGGVARKAWLLAHEGALDPRPPCAENAGQTQRGVASPSPY